MSRSETWAQKRVMRSKRKQDWYYSCQAVCWWGSEKEQASFRYTDGGKAKMQAWQDKYLEADWRVSVKLVRGETMNKNEYYWITMHKAGEANKELQEQDFFVLMGKLNRMLLDGWTIQYGKLMNRRED